jgi:ubiquinone/menaquinone biosynthesis C-methylase UbiE
MQLMSISCSLYRLFIDPLLKSLRSTIVQMIPLGSSVVELGSGTGSQACALGKRCSTYLGIDLNPDSVACAQLRCTKKQFSHIRFKVADGRKLDFLTDAEFDLATLTLALHEMPSETRLLVLEELQRVAKKLIVVDYTTPLPSSCMGRGTRLIEKMAGEAHFAGFTDYQRLGGLPYLLKETGFVILSERTALKGIVSIMVCQSKGKA